jgi:signal transduction histidine kinase
MQAAARAAAEAAEQRARLLAEASRALGASLDSATTLRQLTRTLVPALADRCSVEIPGAGPAGAHEALREAGGEPAGGPASVLRVPLRGAAGELGTLTLVRHDPLRDFGPEEAELARELGRRAALALENARHFADARRATRARDQVLSFVAHDLRNPLGSISASAEMLRLLLPPDAPPAHLQTLARIEQTAQRMHGMVEDLLEVSRLEQGALTVHPVAVPAGPLFVEAEALLRPLSRLHDVALSFHGPAAPLVRADAPRVVQVLSNLVGNGFKFTPAGGRVEVRWRVEAEELVVSVADTGCGIAADELPHVFGSFWQSRPADRRGVGLGLVIARAVVAAHDGRMWVDSRVGVGSTFHFTLPLAAPMETP